MDITCILDARQNQSKHASVRFLYVNRYGRTIQSELAGHPQSHRLHTLLLRALREGITITKENF